MAKIDDLIKELRDAIKDPKDAKKASLAFNRWLKHKLLKWLVLRLNALFVVQPNMLKMVKDALNVKNAVKNIDPLQIRF